MGKDVEKEPPPPPIESTWWKHLTAGGASGVISRTLTAPLDRLKVLSQVTGKSYQVVKGLTHLIETDGFYSLWRGNGINMLKIVPESATKFMVYEMAKVMMMGQERKPLSTTHRFISASIAGVASQTVIYPVEVVKTRLVIHHGETGMSLRAACQRVISKLGYLGFFRGYPSAMAGMVLFTGIDLTVYEKTKIFLMRKFDTGGQVPAPLLIVSAIAACITGQAAAFPLAMSSTAVQVADDWKTTARGILMDRYRQHGLVGLFRGANMTYLKAIPAVVITYLVYENVLWSMGASMTI